MSRIKNIAALGLIALILFFNGGMNLLYEIRMEGICHEVKWEVLKNMPEEELVLIKLPADCFRRPPKGFIPHEEKEFEYFGEMYDIVSKKITGDTLLAYCYHDTKETKVKKKMEKRLALLFENNGKSKAHKKALNKTLSQKYLGTGFDVLPPFARAMVHAVPATTYQDRSYRPDHPPPRPFS